MHVDNTIYAVLLELPIEQHGANIISNHAGCFPYISGNI